MKVFCILIFVPLMMYATLDVSAKANMIQLNISGNFEGGNTPGRFAYIPNSNGLDIKYYSPSQKRDFSYFVEKFDECSSMAMYRIPNTRQVAIDGSCPSQGGQIYRYVYEWKDSHSTWCLVRVITGERAAISSGIIAPSEQVSRVKDCFPIGSTGPYKYESTAEVAQEISAELADFRVATRDGPALKRYLSSVPSYSISELAIYVNHSNEQDINDLAFYLSRNGRSYEAIRLLEEIVTRSPNRAVAKLNLADSYWDNSLKGWASAQYKAYQNEMLARGLGQKIPERVGKRIAE